ncbi:MAG: hypothetical protein J6M18_00835 [Actinomycetaceae bacterium]|nr:hypothetical protein [Actinomycetaceae bacterium]
MKFSLKKTFVIFASCALLFASSAGFAFAWSGPNKGRVWEDWIGGARVHASIQFQPSYADHYWSGKYTKQAKHAVQGSVTLSRQAGPSLYKKAYTARYSRNYKGVVKKEIWAFDSILWGKKYITRGNYNLYWVN